MANGDNRFTGLLGNPMFTVGMGLLSGNQQGDPWGGVLSGLQSAQAFQTEEQKREREEQLRRELQQYLAGNQGRGGATAQFMGKGPTGAAGHTQPPRTVAEAATMRAQAMGEPAPELSPADYYTPIQAQTSPAGLLDGQATPASVQQINAPIGEAAEATQPTDQVAATAETPGEAIGTPRQEQAAAVDAARNQVQGILGPDAGSIPAGTASDADAMAMFGLLAQYGDPQKAAEGYINYRQGQQRLQLAQGQMRTQGLAPITAADGTVYFRDFNAPGGVVVARDPITNEPIKAPQGMTYITDSAGNTRVVPRTVAPGQDPTPRTVVSAEDVAESQADVDAIAHQAARRRALGGIEDLIAQPGGAWETVNTLLSDEMTGTRELMTGGSAWAGEVASWWPGSQASDFKTLQGKLGSQAFIDSITQLRQQGGTVGQITEREGAKLENARLRLVNATSEEAFKQELENFRDSLQAFLRAARREAGVDLDAPYVPGGVDFRTEGQRARDEAAQVELDEAGSSRLEELRKSYNLQQGN